MSLQAGLDGFKELVKEKGIEKAIIDLKEAVYSPEALRTAKRADGASLFEVYKTQAEELQSAAIKK